MQRRGVTCDYFVMSYSMIAPHLLAARCEALLIWLRPLLFLCVALVPIYDTLILR